jgi:hypothetical protein
VSVVALKRATEETGGKITIIINFWNSVPTKNMAVFWDDAPCSLVDND